ncbi:MAG: hypothetical protein FWE68_06560 [Defluviitaleaceae bacterium]|nr:hypothetical protein [Defluviitaleaceae bacterium]
MKKFISAALAFVVLTTPAAALAYGDMMGRATYWYDDNRNAIPIPDVYTFQSLNPVMDMDGALCEKPADMRAAGDTLYVLDSGTGAVYLLNERLETVKVISSYRDARGGEYILNGPEGIFIDSDKNLYIADTQNSRILMCDMDGTVLKVFGRPEGMIASVDLEAAYLPTKIAVDTAGRMYAISRNNNLGIISMDSKGEFISAIGAPLVSPGVFGSLRLRFMTKEQREQIARPAPTEFSNLTIDSLNFIYGTIGSLSVQMIKNTIFSKDMSGNTTPIRKLNMAGNDVLYRKGAYPPIGDLEELDGQYSRIVDVALGGNGIYSLLDSNRGRIFTYDNDGNLLFAFGEIGDVKGALKNPISIDYFSGRIVVLDSVLRAVSCYQTTDYGALLLGAVGNQYMGEYDNAYAEWSEIIRYNSNYRFAYRGLGYALLKSSQYEKAMNCFEVANDKYHYSIAYKQQRKIVLGSGFQVIFICAAALILVLVFYKIVRAVWRYIRGVKVIENAGKE